MANASTAELTRTAAVSAESAVTKGGLTPEQQQKAKSFRTWNEENNPNRTLQAMEAATQKPPIDANRGEALIKQRTEKVDDQNKATAAVKALEKFDKHGWTQAEKNGGLSNTEKTAILNTTFAQLSRLDTFQAAFAGKKVTDPEVQKILVDFLQDSNTQGFLRELYDGKMNPANAEALAQKIAATRETIGQKEVDFKKVQAEVQAKKDELDALAIRETQFSTPPAPGAQNKQEQLNELNGRLPDLQKGKREKEQSIAREQAKISENDKILSQLKDGGYPIDEINRMRTENQRARVNIDNLKNELIPIDGEIEKQNTLQTEKDSFITDKRKLEIEKAGFDAQKVKLENDLTFAKLDLNAEEIKDLQFYDLVGDAAVKSYLKRMEDSEEGFIKFNEEEKQKAQDAATKAFREGLGNAWHTSEEVRRFKIFGEDRTIYKVDRGEIRQNYYDLLSGTIKPADLVRDMLVKGGMDPAEAANKSLDAAFVESVQGDVLQRLIGLRMKNGGISKNEGERIVTSPWGGEMLTKALSQNKEVESKLQDLMKSEGYRGSTVDFIRSQGGKNTILTILLAMAGLVGAAVLAPVALPAVGGAIGLGGLAAAGIAAGKNSEII